MQETEITVDHNYLYVNQEKFFPIIQEQNIEFENLEAANAVLITVPASSQSDLVWDQEFEYAKQVLEKGKWILWEIDFGFQNGPVFIHDSTLFYSFGIAIEEFVSRLWTPFKHRSLGVCLFRGDIDFSKHFIWTEQHQEYFQEKISDHLSQRKLKEGPAETEEAYLKAFFAADIFTDYLHRLSSFLPEEVLPFCLLDVSSAESLTFLAYLLSKERFQHLLLGLKKSKIPLGHMNWEEGACLGGWIGQSSPYFSTVSEIKVGVCLPREDQMDMHAFSILDDVLQELSGYNLAFRTIPETFLNENWDGIDDLIVLSSQITDQGKRKLYGFQAAGGRIVYVGESFGFLNEISWEEYTKLQAPFEAFF